MVTVQRRLQRIASGFNAKARKWRVPGVVTAEMLAMKGSRCAYCPTELSLWDGTWDHVVPFDKGAGKGRKS